MQSPHIKNSESWQFINLKLTTSIADTEMLFPATGIFHRISSYKIEKAGKIAFSQRRLFLECLGSLQLSTVHGKEGSISP